MNKKGISMVALVITIIVLIILTGAVVLTGVNAPTSASQAVANYNKATMQDAVTIYVMNYIANNSTAANIATVSTAINAVYNTSTSVWTKAASTTLGVSEDILKQYKVDGNGKVTPGTSTIAPE